MLIIFPEDLTRLGRTLFENYSEICKFIGDPSLDEPIFRTVIDRAYYSAFLTAREWLDIHHDDFEITRKGEDHKNVRRCLKTSDGINGISLAGKIHYLRKDRNSACYDIDGGHSKVYDEKIVKDILITTELFNDSFSK